MKVICDDRSHMNFTFVNAGMMNIKEEHERTFCHDRNGLYFHVWSVCTLLYMYIYNSSECIF